MADFSLIRYANCWEDAELLTASVGEKQLGKVLSIASGGDNSFALLCKADEVIAVDVSEPQLWLCNLKRFAIKELAYKEFLEFLGFEHCVDRMQYYRRLRHNLPAQEQAYWQSNEKLIQNGLIHAGKFERYFRLFRNWVLPFIHWKKRKEQLFLPKSAQEQAKFYKEKWESLNWRLLFRLFFGKWAMGRLGRDPEFLRHVKVPVHQYIYQKASNHLSSVQCQQNYFLHYIFWGNFGSTLPFYARKENFDLLKQKVDRLVLFKGFVQDVGNQYGKFDFFNLSNIFEYMDVPTFANVSQSLVKMANPEALFAYWNLMVPRRMADQCSGELLFLAELSAKLTAMDKGFFYQGLFIDQFVKQ